MELRDKNVLVVGAGKSGIAACGFLLGKGATVTLTDIRDIEKYQPPIKDLASRGVFFVFGDYPEVRRGSFDYIVVSPGVPLSVEPIVSAGKQGIPVFGELELAFSFAAAPFVAITGTNGKTTTTALTGRIFKNAGFETLVAGNIGHPLVKEIESYNSSGAIIAEVSSFQLESTISFKPRVAAILNITPDHLDRHGTLEDYIRAKARVFKEQGPDDCLILNFDDPATAGLAAECPGRVIFFSRRNNLDCGVFLDDKGMIVSVFDGIRTEIMPARDLGIPGPHNLENALAAVACTLLFGIGPEIIARTLEDFPGVEHRLEFVRELDGVRYVNDSKGTNPDASIKALDSFNQPIILIAGGRNKGNNFLAFAEKAKQKARLVITLGECAGEVEDSLRSVGFKGFVRVPSFEEAVLEANRNARSGDLVLLSPACASWDMFSSYEERGELFKKLVNSLEVTKCR